MKRISSKCAKLALLLSISLLPLSGFAKEINLYEQPNATSAVAGKVDLSAGVIPIFTQEKGEWMKVGDPRNGNTGWVKVSEVNKSNRVAFSQEFINDNNGMNTYFFQYGGNPKPLSKEQSQKMMKAALARQKALQKEMQHEIEDMNRHFAQFEHDDWPYMFGHHYPMMPVVFVPVQQKAQAAAKPQIPAATQTVPTPAKS